jgi:hypothetical protein
LNNLDPFIHHCCYILVVNFLLSTKKVGLWSVLNT